MKNRSLFELRYATNSCCVEILDEQETEIIKYKGLIIDH